MAHHTDAMTTDAAAPMKELRRAVQPIVDAANSLTHREANVEFRPYVARVESAAMLVVARAQAEALRGAACRCYDGQTNATSYVCGTHRRLAAAEALVAELEEEQR